jgi:hypothetical protein
MRLVRLLLSLHAGGDRVMNVQTVAPRVLAEFNEMPGMVLTLRQAARLFGLDQEFCRVVIDTLVDSAYLRMTTAGAVTRGDRVMA